MEFAEVVRKRKMVRTYDDRPVERDVVDRILQRAQRAPSAGFSQGFAFVVLEGQEETGRFWKVVAFEEGWPGEGMKHAPVLIVPLAGKHVYLDRYAEPDKGWDDRAESRWPVPYWIVDTAFASMLILLAAVDEGLGALFFGLDGGGNERFVKEYGVPEGWAPIGVIALGYPAPVDPVRSSAHSRPRKSLEEIVHRGRW